MVVITIVGMPPAETVRLASPLVVETGLSYSWFGANSNVSVTINAASVRPFVIERDYSASKPEWRQWCLGNDSGQFRNAALAFLASPGSVINTLEFLDCLPRDYSLGPGTNGVVVERLTLHPTSLPP